jgi:hypothetical protein
MRYVNLLVAVAMLLLAGCGPSQSDAEQALVELRAATTGLAESARRFAPDDLQRVESRLVSLEQLLEQRDFAAVVEAAPRVQTELDELKATTVAQQAQFEAELAQRQAEWSRVADLTAAMERTLATRLTMLAKQPKLPDNLPRDVFAQVGADFARARADFAAAGRAAQQGDFARAAVLGKRSQEMYEGVMRDVGIAPALEATD